MCWCRSRVDTTSIQALVDARNEIERWADHPVEFHFASILSPWIRRPLVAGGLGYHRLQPDTSRRHDVASVSPPYDVLHVDSSSSTDIEAREAKEVPFLEPSYRAIDDEASAVQVDTPFFHFDLAEAVAAAEWGFLRRDQPRRR